MLKVVELKNKGENYVDEQSWKKIASTINSNYAENKGNSEFRINLREERIKKIKEYKNSQLAALRKH